MGYEIGKQTDRRFVAGRAHRLDISDIVRIHSNDQIKPVKILSHQLPRAQVAEVDIAGAGSFLHRAIGRVSDMPARGSGAVGCVMQRAGAKRALGSWRTADIAQADEKDTVCHGNGCSA